MIRDRSLRAREKLVGKLQVTGELLRGSLLERIVRHTKDCPKCARGEGRISVVKRRHGLDRCHYKGDAGKKRWVGLGVIADNIVNIGRSMEKQSVQ
jgi:hypothetical protein